MTDHEVPRESERFVATPARTKRLLGSHGFSLKKSLGQNFLIDLNTLDRIVEAAALDRSCGVLEIGPGAGALTQKLADIAGRVVAVELDQRLLPLLNESLSGFDNVRLIHGDILKVDLGQIWTSEFAGMESVHVVANLPYYITTPIMMMLLECHLPLKQMVVMMQKEVADRLVAKPGGKDYGSLTVAVQYYCEAVPLLRVPRTVFLPPPNVDSVVLGLKVRPQPAVVVESEPLFFDIVRSSFAQRRKTISNNLLHRFSQQLNRAQVEDVLSKAEIAPERRAETLSIAEFARLSDAFLCKLGP